MYGFYRIAMCTPTVHIAAPGANVSDIISMAAKAYKSDAMLAVFPELNITSASCQSLFMQDSLLTAAHKAILAIVKDFPEGILGIMGAPLMTRRGSIIDAALVIKRGTVLACVPKCHTTAVNAPQFFATADESDTVVFPQEVGGEISVSPYRIFSIDDALTFGISIGDDIALPCPLADSYALAGASVIINPSAILDAAGTCGRRMDFLKAASYRSITAIIHCNVSPSESTTDGVYGGQAIVAEAGDIIAASQPFSSTPAITFVDIDVQRIQTLRNKRNVFSCRPILPIRTIALPCEVSVWNETSLYRPLPAKPFIPSNPADSDGYCQEIRQLQVLGLAKRITHIRAKKLVIGISGGLDSTLALLACANTMKHLQRPMSDIIAVTMPGFGTTDRTVTNAVTLCKNLGATLRDVSIVPACNQHFQDIGHDPENRNVVYENSQARERTQILLDIANQTGGIVVGTGDLSEIALGWCTFNGDHIAMYNVNATIPKSVIATLLKYQSKDYDDTVKDILQDVIDTPVSPELLPPDANGNIRQITENIIGPYELHDFFIYHTLINGVSREKLQFLAKIAFGHTFTQDVISQHLGTFYRRFTTQQFKRNCSPDGVKTLELSLSPRAAWFMPSDAESPF